MTTTMLVRTALPEKDLSVDDKLNARWFLPEVFKSLDYIKGFVGAKVIFQMMQLGVFDDLLAGKHLEEIATARSLNSYLLRTVFEYLVVENILIKERQGDSVSFRLSDYGSHIKCYEGWFNIFVGGYDNIFSHISTMLKDGIGGHQRDGMWVGIGSCQISTYDTIPITKEFIKSIKPETKCIVDFGCGNALYLCTLAKELEGIKAIGIEPNHSAYVAGLEKIAEMGLQERVSLVNRDALDYDIQNQPDFILFGFVLQEIVAQIGRPALTEYLRQLGKKFADSYLIVMEVDYDIDNERIMQSPMGRGYYNPYFLLHPFTNQLLLPKKDWDDLWAAAGYEIVRDEVTSSKADPSGFGLCYVLKYRGTNPCPAA